MTVISDRLHVKQSPPRQFKCFSVKMKTQQTSNIKWQYATKVCK